MIRSTMQRVPLSSNTLLERAGKIYPQSEVISRLPDKYRRPVLLVKAAGKHEQIAEDSRVLALIRIVGYYAQPRAAVRLRPDHR